jgi:hypothetical protein
MTRVERFKLASYEVDSLIQSFTRPILDKACRDTLRLFPKAKRVAVESGMGVVWIQIDNLAFHSEDDGYHVVGYKDRCTGHRHIKAWRLNKLATTMRECMDFLDQYNQWPFGEAIRKD